MIMKSKLTEQSVIDLIRNGEIKPTPVETTPSVDDIEKNFELFKLIYRLYELEHPTTEPKFTSYPTTIKL